jgi:ankyrin repeat protein
MYHAYKATRLHDKIYALLGMCSDDLEATGLEPNYHLGWRELMRRLVKFILGSQVSIDACEDREMAFIRANGHILGKVSRVMNTKSGGQRVTVDFKSTIEQPGSIAGDSTSWTLPNSATAVQNEDLICLLEGTSKPTIIRLHDDHFVIVMIAAVPSEQTDDKIIKRPDVVQSVSPVRGFSLVWNWELTSEKKLTPRKYHNLIQESNWGWPETGLVSQMKNVVRTWSVARILEDVGENEKAREMLQKAVNAYATALGEEQSQIPRIQNGVTLLSWSARKGHEDVVRLLLDKDKVDTDLQDTVGRTPLSWAAEGGYEAVVTLLLATDKVDADLQDTVGRTPLSWAAEGGHEAVVKLLLATDKVNVDFKGNWCGRTPLSLAAEGGHEAVVKLLLATDKVNVDFKGNWCDRTPLSLAAEGGREAVVKLLLATGKVDVDSKDIFGQTPLSLAAKGGHEAVVKMLLATGKVDIGSQDQLDRTPLWLAAEGGHEAVVKLLLATGKADVDSKDIFGQTPLSLAAKGGHVAVVKLLHLLPLHYETIRT